MTFTLDEEFAMVNQQPTKQVSESKETTNYISEEEHAVETLKRLGYSITPPKKTKFNYFVSEEEHAVETLKRLGYSITPPKKTKDELLRQAVSLIDGCKVTIEKFQPESAAQYDWKANWLNKARDIIREYQLLIDRNPYAWNEITK